jgi:hypothetical protein
LRLRPFELLEALEDGLPQLARLSIFGCMSMREFVLVVLAGQGRGRIASS